MVDLGKIKRILVIRLSSLGDILLTTPLLRSIKCKYQNMEIDFLVREEYSDTIKLNPNLSNVYKLSRRDDSAELIEELKSRDYDLIIDLQNNFRSTKIAKKLNTEVRKYRKPNFKKFLLVKAKINLLKDMKSIPVRYSEALEKFELDNKGLELHFSEDNIRLEDNKYIGIAPGSRHFTKMWPEEYFIELGNMLEAEGYIPVLFGGASDLEICQTMHKSIKSSVNLCNDNNLLETAANMAKCKAIICNDSGMMHTASAVGTPVVTFFGSTVQEFGFAPYGVKSILFEIDNLSCRPCSHIGRSRCPKGHFKCMKDITPNFVYNELIRFIDI